MCVEERNCIVHVTVCLCAEWLFVNFLAENLPGINGADALIGCTFFLFCPGGNWNRTAVTTTGSVL